MKKWMVALAAAVMMAGMCNAEQAKGEAAKAKKVIKVAVITGGHAFEKEGFLSVFEGQEGIEYTHLAQKDHSEIFEDINNWPYDVIVLYNMSQKITSNRQANFVELLKRGVGVVALHHCIAAWSTWPEYRKIIGGKYYSRAVMENGVQKQQSQYKHDVNVPVHIEDKTHPVMAGLSDFVLFDETYKYYDAEGDNKILLTTTEATSDKAIGWVRRYGKARVCYIQPGHGMETYKNENYRKLVGSAIRWSANKD